jgi:hypothetical protein
MIVGFDISAFKGRAKTLTSVLQGLRVAGQWPLQHHKEVEEIICKNPSWAYNYCRQVVGAFGVSGEGERVFLKNPGIGIRYLACVNRDHFLVEDTQRRFWKKVVKSPELARQWAEAFRKRLPEEDEMVFVQDPVSANDYAHRIIRGPFPEKVHHALVLKSFENMNDYEARRLKEYIAWAAPMLKSLEETKA